MSTQPTLFGGPWLEPVAIAEVAVVPEAAPGRKRRRVGWRQTALSLVLVAPDAVPPAAQPTATPSVEPPKATRAPRAATATKASRRAVKANPLMPLMLAKAEGRRLGLYARDEWAEVVIVVPAMRDAMEREVRQIPNEPDRLGRVAFTAKGYYIKSHPNGWDNFADVRAFIDRIEGLGRKWRMG